MLNRRMKPKGDHPGVQPFVLSDGTVITDENHIREAWGQYFQQLYTPKSPPQYNDALKREITERLRDVSLEPCSDDTIILRDYYPMMTYERHVDC